MFWILLILTLATYWLYRWSTLNFNVFKERGVPHKKPLPLIGNSRAFLSNTSSLHKIILKIYKETKQYKVYGMFNFRNAIFLINDPEIIKKMAIKDFDSFPNHQQIFNTDNDPLIGGMLTIMKDKRWRDMRNTLTPCFTGAKMRAMFTLMNDCFAECIKDLHNKLGNAESFDVELKDCFCRLSNDLIATTAFGLKINSFVDRKNEFLSIGQQFTQARGRQALKFMLLSMAPKVFDFLGLKLFDQNQLDYFVKLVVDAMKYREEQKIVRPDMIQLLIEAKKEATQNWSNEEIVAQCFIFFFAAFENNANLLCTVCYELMHNPDIQEKLLEEIMEIKQSGATMDYDTLKKMKYMDMVIMETQRKWSIVAILDRECNKDYKVTDKDDNFICDLKKGDRIWFQTIGLHWDNEYFENAEKFDPERFSEENRSQINPFTYMPFGVGPRNCIGNRYALMQAKAMLFYLLSDFKVEPCEKSSKNLLDDIRGFQMQPKNGFWFKLVKRQ